MSGDQRVVARLFAKDLTKTLDYYSEALGFELTSFAISRDDPPWLEVARDGLEVQFYSDSTDRTSARPVTESTLRFVVDDIDAWDAELLGRRVVFAQAPQSDAEGERYFALRDPNGYRLEFRQTARRRRRPPRHRRPRQFRRGGTRRRSVNADEPATSVADADHAAISPAATTAAQGTLRMKGDATTQ